MRPAVHPSARVIDATRVDIHLNLALVIAIASCLVVWIGIASVVVLLML
jgi:hypothetical protein